MGPRVPEDWVGSCTCVFGDDEPVPSRLPTRAVAPRRDRRRSGRRTSAQDHVGYGGTRSRAARQAARRRRAAAGHVHPDGASRARNLGVAGTARPRRGSRRRDHAGCDRARRLPRDVSSEAARTLRRRRTSLRCSAALIPAVRAGGRIRRPRRHAPCDRRAGSSSSSCRSRPICPVLLEWDGFGIDDPDRGQPRAGLGHGAHCVDRSARDPEALRGPPPEGSVARLLPEEADRSLGGADRAGAGGRARAGFRVLVVLEAKGRSSPRTVRRSSSAVAEDGPGARTTPVPAA